MDGSRPWLDPHSLPERPSSSDRYLVQTSSGVEDFDNEEQFRARLDQMPRPDWVGFPNSDRLIPAELADAPPSENAVARRRKRIIHRLWTSGLYLVAAAIYLVYHVSRSGGFTPPVLLTILALFFLVLRPVLEDLVDLQETTPGLSAERRNRLREEWSLFLSWIESRPMGSLKGFLGVLGGIFLLQMALTSGHPLLKFFGFPSLEAATLVPKEVTAGKWWLLLTCGFLHGHLIHLWFNSVALYDIGRILVALLRPGIVALVFLISVLAGSLASWLSHPLALNPAVGASGGVLGVLGFLAVLSFQKKVGLPKPLRFRVGLSIGLVTILGVLGSGFIDNAAHAGGFVGGALLALILPAKTRIWSDQKAQGWVWAGWAAGAVLLAGILTTVYLLLRASS